MSLTAALSRVYGALGQMAYDTTVALESRLYGLRKTTLKGGDVPMVAYVGGRATAPAVFLVHGYSADKVVWVRFARHLVKRYRVFVVDLPGHGETAYDPRWSYHVTTQAGRIIQAMDALGIARAHVVGNSMGGFIAARLAHDHPDRLRSATLIDPAGVHSPEPSDMERMAVTGRNPFLVHSQAEFRAFYAMTMARPPWMPGMALHAIGRRYMAQREQLAHIFSHFYGIGMLDDQLPQIRVPVLVMWGRKDRLLHVSAAAVWTTGIPGARQVIYDELGHMPMLEAPARAARDVLHFLESVPP